uniref:U1-type domain-containing protein n=1 Tax=Strigamia maritima TaxID=126957 RepID=T1IHH3_STRMM
MADHRRKWNREEYEEKAKKRRKGEDATSEGEDEEFLGEPLKARDFRVDLESKVGKSSIVAKTTHQSQTGGYFCDVCDCTVKDSLNYLDHMNSKKHQQNLGMGMDPERSTLETVKKRFEFFKNNKGQKRPKQPLVEYKLKSRLKQQVAGNVATSEKERIRDKQKDKKKKLSR